MKTLLLAILIGTLAFAGCTRMMPGIELSGRATSCLSGSYPENWGDGQVTNYNRDGSILMSGNNGLSFVGNWKADGRKVKLTITGGVSQAANILPPDRRGTIIVINQIYIGKRINSNDLQIQMANDDGTLFCLINKSAD